MREETKKISISCFLGGFIGTFFALELGTLWPLGAIAGGVIAYLTYDFGEVREKAGMAWHDVSGWKPDLEFWKKVTKRYAITYVAMFILIYYLFTFFFALSVLVYIIPPTEVQMGFKVALPMVMGITLYLSLFFISRADGELKELESLQEAMVWIIKYLNPISLIFIIPYLLLKGTWWTLKHTPAGVKTIYHFVKKTIIYIHSDERNLCLTDASLGAVLGYSLGSAIAGGIAGLIFGVINYEIVSVKILGVVKAE